MLINNERLLVAGVNFRKTGLPIRNKFALTPAALENIYSNADSLLHGNFFILSTCNRTEIYSTCDNPDLLLNFLSVQSGLSREEISVYVFYKSGDEAVKHLFHVAAGLDSQILGDHEIIGQLKKAFSLAKSFNAANGFLEKLVNTALQASKQVKNRTNISDGTTTVSYAVIQLLKQLPAVSNTMHICIAGLGKIGVLTLKNIRHYLPGRRITLVNRSAGKAEIIAQELDLNHSPIEALKDVLKDTDVLVVATGADYSIISKEHIEGTAVKVIFDLSVPSNVHINVKELCEVKLYNIDQLSALVNESIEARRNEIPFAEAIIDEHIAELEQWILRRNMYSIKSFVMPKLVS